jgi:hypothetical protein
VSIEADLEVLQRASLLFLCQSFYDDTVRPSSYSVAINVRFGIVEALHGPTSPYLVSFASKVGDRVTGRRVPPKPIVPAASAREYDHVAGL